MVDQGGRSIFLSGVGGLENLRRRREFVGGLGVASHSSENKVKNPGLPPVSSNWWGCGGFK